MPTHPLWRPLDPAAQASRNRQRLASRQVNVAGVVASDPSWTSSFETVRALIEEALGSRALAIDHVGSTSVVGLAAKPILDVDLTVADSADEGTYLPPLETAGFRLIAREPEWEEHRFVTLGEPNTNVHVFSPGAVEPWRHLVFRNWVRRHDADRDAYAQVKLGLAGGGFGAFDYGCE